MVMTDEELAVSQHRSKNLILIGGPVANQQVLLLVECGLTSFDTWLNSEGDIEYIEEREYGEILIVAGKDRNATLKAAKDLVSII
jgi:S-layer protein (TIGR01564 family)